MVRRRVPRLFEATSALVVLNGCGLVAGLGDAKMLGSGPGDGSPSYYAQRVAVGGDHACATVIEGTANVESVVCWGNNAHGELGIDPGAVAASATPAPIASFAPGFAPADLALALGYSCVISEGRYLACWGTIPRQGATGLHRQGTLPVYEPALMDLMNKPIFPIAGISPGASGGCVIERSELVCWGNQEFLAGRDAGTDSGATISPPEYHSVAVGATSACAIDQTGAIDCWGDDTYGQAGGSVGAGKVANPTLIPVPGPFRQVAVGQDFACALGVSGSVSCWGHDDKGQLGPNAEAMATGVPVELPLGIAASSIALGDHHACAVLTDADETVACWGDNTSGQLGRGATQTGASPSPARVQRVSTSGSTEDLPHVVQIAAGGGTTCVVRINDPEVSCWGANDAGQSGQRGEDIVVYATPIAW